jgi:predicted transposase/invertase (TIGR01784 family)
LISCAILTDARRNWRPNEYQIGFDDSYLYFKFITIKLLDYQAQKTELENSSNPFASVILVQLAAIESKSKSPEQRKNVKFALTKRLYEKGFSKQKIDYLYRFIDYLIGLPCELEVNYLESVYKLEEMFKMPYVTSAERFGMEKGREEGRDEAKVEDARAMLHEGFDPVLIAKITKLPIEKIKQLQ